MSAPPDSVNLNRLSSKRKHKPEDLKQLHFFDTFVTRRDVIKLASLENDAEMKQHLISMIAKFEQAHKEGGQFNFTVYHLITFEYHQTQTISKATEESQTQCRHNIFSEFLLAMYKHLNRLTFEQKSAFMSLGFFIFVESLERKITQIDSYELFKKLLRPQILLTNTYNIPLCTQEQIMDFNKFMTDYFFKYYSMYELRMTTYQEVNIYGRLKGEAVIQTEKSDHEDSIDEEDEFGFQDVEQSIVMEPEADVVQQIDEVDQQHISQVFGEFAQQINIKIGTGTTNIIQEAEKVFSKKK